MRSCRDCRDVKLCGEYGLPGDCAVYCWVSGEKLIVDGEDTRATVGGKGIEQ